MKDTRRPLPPGTKVRFESGSIFEISGEPIGFGGGSIIYPALKYAKAGETEVSDGLDYVLKECFPISGACAFIRRDDGEIVPEEDGAENAKYLRLCKEMQLREEEISKKLYKTAIHTLPIKESSCREEITLPGRSAHAANNVFTLMDSLSLKGASLSSYTKMRKMLPLRQSFSVVRQLLYALKEMHDAGFLHLDIQTGNIFIQGSLTKGECIVTLIDFGCARELKDGHTSAIGDRIVFTTPGFAAPEILLHNDGTLMLTPAADVYSVGCVLLNLLTGKKYASGELISKRTGRYIDAMRLYRINCPRHLTDKLQQIIAKALENDPGERYLSADAMIEDVEAFLSALPLPASPLSNTVFNAFISYRHGDVDSRAALEIQKRLERFRAPKEISSSHRPFRKCYVDEGELSSGYDYAKQLREVLKNSEWLIAVCSPGTGDSRWVNEEIDIFLEYHDRSRILAVLTGGEPEQSFPPRLLEETPQGDLLIAADARGQTIKDVLAKIRGDALLKLAAPMLSTTFDSLKQREKIYRLRRAAVSAAVLAFFAAAFGIYAAKNAATIAKQAERIEEEYKTALLNESLFLTEQANNRLDDDDTTGATELALRALPSETLDRPVLPEAKNVLETALGVYEMPGYEGTFEATKCFSSEKVYEMFACGDGQHMLTLEDEEKRICLRDTEFNLINSVYFTKQFTSAGFTPELLISDRSEILLTNSGGLYRWNYESGEMTKLKDGWVSGALLSSDGNRAAIIYHEYDESYKTSCYIALTDTRTGETSKTFLIDDDYSEFDYTTEPLIFSPDESGLYFTVSYYTQGFLNDPVSRICYLDFTSGEISALLTVPDYISAIKIVDRYLVGCSSFDRTYYVGEDIIDRSSPANLFIYDLENGETVCSIEETKFGFSYNCSVEAVDFDDGNARTKAAAFVYADFCELIELSSGKVLRKYDFSSPVLLGNVTENGITAILRNGCMAMFDFTEETVPALSKYFQSDLEEVCIPAEGGCVFARTEDKILRYEFGSHDKNFAELESAPVNSDTSNFLYESGEELSRFTLLDDDKLYITETRENKCSCIAIPFVEPEDDKYTVSEDTLLGSSTDGEYFYVKRDLNPYRSAAERPDASEYYVVSVRGGSAIYSDETIFSDENVRVEAGFFFEGCVYYAVRPIEDDKILLLSWTPGSADTTTLAAYDLPGGTSVVPSSLNVTEEYICFALEDDSGGKYLFTAFDRENGCFLSASAAVSSAGEEIVWDTYTWDVERGESLYMLHTTADDGSDSLFLRISSADGGSVGVEHASSYNDYDLYRIIISPAGRLFVVDENGISEYSRDGELLNCVEPSRISDIWLYNYFNYSFIDDERLLICTYPASYVINLGEGRAAAEEELVRCVGYDMRDDNFIVFGIYYDDDDNSKPALGSFHRYSTQELIEMGRDFIK